MNHNIICGKSQPSLKFFNHRTGKIQSDIWAELGEGLWKQFSIDNAMFNDTIGEVMQTEWKRLFPDFTIINPGFRWDGKKETIREDLYVLIAVLGLTVFYNLIFALGAGIVLAALLYAKRVADNTQIKTNTYNPSDYSPLETKVERDSHYKIRILHIDGQFFFGSITQIVSHFDELLETEYIILNYSSNSELDMSAIFALEDIIVRLQAQRIKLYLVVANEKVFKQIQSLDIMPQIGADCLFSDETAAINQAITNTHLEKIIE